MVIVDLIYALIAQIMAWCFSLYAFLTPYCDFFGTILGLLAFSLFLRFLVYPFISSKVHEFLRTPTNDNRSGIKAKKGGR